jgi:hypothetical protein
MRLHCLKLKHRLENDEGLLLIELPVYPSTIEELALIRFWLLKLSQANFEKFYAYDNDHGIINPEFLSLINPITGPRKILFHANYVRVGCLETAIRADFAQFICTRRIDLYTLLIDDPHRYNLFKFITGTGNALKICRIFTDGSKQGEFCEHLVNVSFDRRSFLTLFVSKFVI